MNIKNDIVTIKIGEKKFDFTNLIFDVYLNKFAKSQINKDNIEKFETDLKLSACLVKFDTTIYDVKSDSILNNSDFDICFIGAEINQNITESQIIVQYDYNSNFIYDYNKKVGGSEISIKNYYGKKITALGFNVTWTDDTEYDVKVPVCAFLDVSNHNIFLQNNQEFSVTRKDIIITDALFYSNDTEKVPGPAHICPCGLPQIINQDLKNNAYGILYSVGLGKKYNIMENEKIIGIDLTIEQNNNQLIIKTITNYLEHSRSNIIGMVLNSIFDDKVLKRNEYFIFKYKIFQKVYTNSNESIVDTGYYYYQAIPVTKYGKTILKIIYERS